MRLSKVVSALLTFTAVSSQALIKRDAPTVLSDISKISEDISSLTTLTASYNGSDSQTSPFISAYSSLKANIEITTTHTDESPLFTTDESYAVADALRSLTSSVIPLLEDLKKKAPIVASAGHTAVVRGALVVLNDDAIAMFHSIEGTVVLPAVSAIDPSQRQIEFALRDAIAVFT
ncbi:hydrophobic surface binding protein A-domain-containing protein [Bisporella sp. PMI_857]|nr:hydrophobic surface binding protein A-domain-containing protein [Bisporella sp. PMI_857]